MDRYLLSNGRSTYLVEYYIMDLIKLYLQVFPKDIPGAPGLGFDFRLSGAMKANLQDSVEQKVVKLIDTVANDFGGGVDIALDSVEIVGEDRAKVSITINRNLSEDVIINLYDEE